MNTLFSFLVIAQAAAPPPGEAKPPGIESMLIPLIAFGVIFYFLIIRPQRKKEKDHQVMVSALKTGDEVVTSGGIHGRIANVKERTVMLKVADNVKIEMEKQAITTVVKAGGGSAETEPAK